MPSSGAPFLFRPPTVLVIMRRDSDISFRPSSTPASVTSGSSKASGRSLGGDLQMLCPTVLIPDLMADATRPKTPSDSSAVPSACSRSILMVSKAKNKEMSCCVPFVISSPIRLLLSRCAAGVSRNATLGGFPLCRTAGPSLVENACIDQHGSLIFVVWDSHRWDHCSPLLLTKFWKMDPSGCYLGCPLDPQRIALYTGLAQTALRK